MKPFLQATLFFLVILLSDHLSAQTAPSNSERITKQNKNIFFFNAKVGYCDSYKIRAYALDTYQDDLPGAPVGTNAIEAEGLHLSLQVGNEFFFNSLTRNRLGVRATWARTGGISTGTGVISTGTGGLSGTFYASPLNIGLIHEYSLPNGQSWIETTLEGGVAFVGSAGYQEKITSCGLGELTVKFVSHDVGIGVSFLRITGKRVYQSKSFGESLSMFNLSLEVRI
ncbi:MAG: hypothetical protein ACJAUD_000711 [Crocinitomicaceae bacterium]|jgi:hypothetical protein